ncbi:hypothetical protein Cni_G11570 [Canna indica]|uniref:Uncharacterized protein n=1 Tax=Canna indica TaxID=4628 RepID=A0AAQ3QAZ7_9LILI|nr:hypothetical protein Cni_G11570 [Canna indica]
MLKRLNQCVVPGFREVNNSSTQRKVISRLSMPLTTVEYIINRKRCSAIACKVYHIRKKGNLEKKEDHSSSAVVCSMMLLSETTSSKCRSGFCFQQDAARCRQTIRNPVQMHALANLVPLPTAELEAEQ